MLSSRKKRYGSKKTAVKCDFRTGNLNPKYTFDTFVVGSNNNFAHAASLAVADSPGEIYNPLFLYGGVGLGKTHLMHSIAHFILEKDPTKKVLYVTSETFTNELIDALKIGKNGNELAMTTFREKYRIMMFCSLTISSLSSEKKYTGRVFPHIQRTPDTGKTDYTDIR